MCRREMRRNCVGDAGHEVADLEDQGDDGDDESHEAEDGADPVAGRQGLPMLNETLHNEALWVIALGWIWPDGFSVMCRRVKETLLSGQQLKFKRRKRFRKVSSQIRSVVLVTATSGHLQLL